VLSQSSPQALDNSGCIRVGYGNLREARATEKAPGTINPELKVAADGQRQRGDGLKSARLNPDS
jgi:hypothetical protein